MDEAARNPVACGALGRYDPRIVARIADALGAGPREVHAGRGATLWLDREPLRWRSGLTRGLAWSERFPAPDPGRTGSWEEAATGLDACGLVVGPARRAVHSSVSGVAPVYWLDHGDATYFATRVDALVRATPERLDPDWDAWSSIFSLRVPLGERTPFRQIRRLRQFTVLDRKGDEGRATTHRWPWASVDLTDDVDEAADAARAALAEALEPLRPSGGVVLLSGGLDSRMLLGAAHDASVGLTAFTAISDDGHGWEADVAGTAAHAAGAEFEAFGAADGADFRRLWVDHLEASDFQFLLGAFVLPMGPQLERLGRPALDGLAIDVLAVRGGRFYTPEMLDPADGYDAGLPLWHSLREHTMDRAPERALSGAYARAVLRSSRLQYRAETARFEGLRTRALLTQYSTRMLRGVATVPAQTMGRHANVFTPGATNRVARAMLSLDPSLKGERRLLQRVVRPDRIAVGADPEHRRQRQAAGRRAGPPAPLLRADDRALRGRAPRRAADADPRAQARSSRGRRDRARGHPGHGASPRDDGGDGLPPLVPALRAASARGRSRRAARRRRVSEPARNPVVCGALGRYDRAIVERVAGALPARPGEVHADRRSCLWLDREPLRWRSALSRGLAWSERFPAPDPAHAGSWRDAACALDACGLVLGPRRRALHSSVSGAAPVYWLDHDGATYFASRIDALARGVGARLDVDWEAWASMFTLRQPIGERTPFRQIRRLRPFQLLERASGGTRTPATPWPWAEIEPHDDLEAAADATIAELHRVLEPLRATGAAVLLSGGLDSRVVMGVADDARVPLRALTAASDDGLGGWEAGIAADAARAAGIEHETFTVESGAHFRRLWLERLAAIDFQYLAGSFAMPMAPRLRELGVPALDGYALDTFGVQPGRSFLPEVLDPAPGFDIRRVLFQTMQARAMAKAPQRTLGEPYAQAAVRSARRQFRREVERLADSRSQALLSVYSIRGARAISLLPMQRMGAFARVLLPCGTDRVARALLAAHARNKHDRAFYRALLARIESPSARLPVVSDLRRPAAPGDRGRHHLSPEMVDLYASSLRDGPLTPLLGHKLAGHLRDGTLAGALRGTAMHRGVIMLAAFHIWAERYDSVLRAVEPRELLEP